MSLRLLVAASAIVVVTLAVTLLLFRLRGRAGRREFWADAAMASLVGSILLVHLPVLQHYFFADDFFPLADIASESTWGYLRDLFLLRDSTPNWRFLTGLFYLGTYRAFGLNPLPFLLANVLMHAGTALLIFLLTRRVTGYVWPAFLGAAFFGLTAAHAPTVGHITAFTHVLAGFLVMLSIVTLYEGLTRRQLGWWAAASAVSFGGAVAANESAALVAPVLGLVVLWKYPAGDNWWRKPRLWARPIAILAPHAVLGGVAIAVFGLCRCTVAADLAGPGDHIFGNLWIFLGRLLYPVGMEFSGEVGAAHLVAGIVVGTLAIAALLRGSALARICVVFLLLALVPSLPLNWVLAPRHVYLAAVPFSILAGLLFTEAARQSGRLSPLLPGALALLALGAMGVNGWQTVEQNQVFASNAEKWRTLIAGIQERYPDVPPGSRLFVRGGPLTDPFWQDPVEAAGRTLWPDVALFTVPDGTTSYCENVNGELIIIDFDSGRFTPLLVLDVGQDMPSTAPGAFPPVRAIECPEETSRPWLPPPLP